MAMFRNDAKAFFQIADDQLAQFVLAPEDFDGVTAESLADRSLFRDVNGTFYIVGNTELTAAEVDAGRPRRSSPNRTSRDARCPSPLSTWPTSRDNKNAQPGTAGTKPTSDRCPWLSPGIPGLRERRE